MAPSTLKSWCICCATGFLMYKLFWQTKQRKCISLAGNASETVYLPIEIITEILSYLAAKDLHRYKSVCKQWNALIEDRLFTIKFMMCKSKSYQCKLNAKPIPKNTRKYTNILATCDGLEWQIEYKKQPYLLSLFFDNWTSSMSIINRETKRILPIPNPLVPKNITTIVDALAFVPSSGQYKAVKIYSQKGNEKKCAVLTLGGTEHKWRYLDCPKSQNQVCISTATRDCVAVPVGADVHLISVVAIELNYVFEVTSLDLDTECFRVTNVYTDFIGPDFTKVYWPIHWNGSLSFLYKDGEGFNVLVLEDYKKNKWAARFFVPVTFLQEEENANKLFFPLIARHGLLWFRSESFKVIGYDLKTMRIAQTIATTDSFRLTEVLCLEPSFVTLKGMKSL